MRSLRPALMFIPSVFLVISLYAQEPHFAPKQGDTAYAECGVGGNEVNVFTSPSNPPFVANLKCGDRLTILAEQKSGEGIFATAWYKVRTQQGKEGYVSSFFLSAVSHPKSGAGSAVPSPANQPQAHLSAKDYFKRGEDRLKHDDVLGAYDDFSSAETWDAKNKKYETKTIEVGKLASARAVEEANKNMSSDPLGAEDWLQRALKYDSSNTAAQQKMSAIHDQITAATQKTRDAEKELEAGHIEPAQALLVSVEVYKPVVPEIEKVQKEIPAVKLAQAALLEKTDLALALRESEDAQKQAPGSPFVSQAAKTVRATFSEKLVREASSITSDDTYDLVKKLRLVDRALEVQRDNQEAASVQESSSSHLGDLLLTSPSKEVAGARIQLEKLKTAESWITQDSRFSDVRNEVSTSAYPAVRIRVIVPNPEHCPASLNQEQVQKTIKDALGSVARLDNQHWDLSLSVRDVSCSLTDVPSQATQKVNSTYVAGYTQAANPQYVQLQQALYSAQIELAQAQSNYQLNPNFGTGFALGLARGKVNNLQRALASTPPFFQQPVSQQYQYDKFTAFRSYRIGSSVQLLRNASDKSFATEKKISIEEDHSAEGIAGVLPQDRTGVHDITPVLPTVEEYTSKAQSNFLGELKTTVKELAGDYFVASAMNRKNKSDERLASLFYVFDIAEGTTYAKQKENLLSTAEEIVLRDPEQQKTFVDSLNLPIPERVSIQESNPADGQNRSAIL